MSACAQGANNLNKDGKLKMKTIKYIALIILMASMGCGAYTSLLGWQGTAIEYNAYFQATMALGIALWLIHKVLGYAEHKYSKPIVNARDKKLKTSL